MRDLVGDDVIQHEFRGHDQTPGKGNAPRAVATAPAGFGVANCDRRHRLAQARSLRAGAERDFAPGLGL